MTVSLSVDLQPDEVKREREGGRVCVFACLGEKNKHNKSEMCKTEHRL